MKLTVKLTAICILLTLCVTQVQGQEFYEDGSMKLSKVSNNKKYGYKPNHKTSIKVGEIKNEYAYLNALRGPNGEKVQFRRIGSCCEFESNSAAFGTGLLDQYEVYYKGLKEPLILYINSYEFEEPMAPIGFTFAKADKIEKPNILSSDKIIKVKFCNEQAQYSVNNESLLNNKIGEKPTPDTNPTYKGGIDELKKHFANTPLSDERAKDLIFRVAIAFVVDCNGNAGNFMIITKGKGVLETLANQVLKIVNQMPQNWEPATKNGNKVDCYQVLSFSIFDGQLDKVSYR